MGSPISPAITATIPASTNSSDHSLAPTVPSAKKSPWKLFPETNEQQSSSVHVQVVDGVASAAVPREVRENSEPLWKSYIIGHFIGDPPHIGKVHATVNHLWTSAEKSFKVDAHFINTKSVLFRIDDDFTRTRVLRRHFWHIADIPMVVQEWSPITVNSRPDLSAIPIWVDFKNVPDYLFTHKGLKFLGDVVGAYQKLHPNTERCIRLDVARILCVVNLEKPLPEMIHLDGEVESLIQVHYPWLPSRCNTCEQWGHTMKDCTLNRTSMEKQNEEAVLPTNTPTATQSSESKAKNDSGSDTTSDEAEKSLTEVVAKGFSGETEEAAGWSTVQRTGKSSPSRTSPSILPPGTIQLPSEKDLTTFSPTRYDALKGIAEDEEEEGEITEHHDEHNLTDSIGKHVNKTIKTTAGGSRTRSKNQNTLFFTKTDPANLPKEHKNKNRRASSGKH